MIELDYFLYDNLRPSILFGSDFGIKASTGLLGQRQSRPLRAAFRQYCRLTHGNPAHPRDFGAALGGLCPAAGPGYLLCVTLQTLDRAGRRSVAVAGLWCPDRGVLRSVIRDGDPIRSAKALLDAARLPKMLTVTPGGGRAGRPVWSPDETVYVRFARQESIEIAAGLLLGTPAGDPLPSILGITATSRFGAAAKSGFAVVFVKPAHEATEQVLTRLETLPSALSGDRPMTVPAARTRGLDRSPDDPDTDASSSGRPADALPAEAFGAVSILDEPRGWRARVRDATRRPRGWLFAGLALAGPIAVAIVAAWWVLTPRQSPPAPRPDTVQAPLRAIADLDVDLLKNSPGYIAAEQVPVVAARDAARARVRGAYATLIDRGQQLALHARTERVDASTGLEAITLDALEACVVLREAFLAELTAEGSIAGAWCRTVASLEASLGNTAGGDRRKP